jgi:hypothetical protein
MDPSGCSNGYATDRVFGVVGIVQEDERCKVSMRLFWVSILLSCVFLVIILIVVILVIVVWGFYACNIRVELVLV